MTMIHSYNQNMNRRHASANSAEASFSCAQTSRIAIVATMDAITMASIIICALLVLVCLLALVSLQVLALVLVLLVVLLVAAHAQMPRMRKHA